MSYNHDSEAEIMYGKPYIFVAMKFSEERKDFLENHLKSLEKSCAKEIKICSDISKFRVGQMDKNLLDSIDRCELMIADLTGHNNGVYFEAGYATGIKKRVIYICEKKDFNNLHFDVSHNYCFEYTPNDANSVQKLIKDLEETIKGIEKE